MKVYLMAFWAGKDVEIAMVVYGQYAVEYGGHRNG